MRILFHCPPPWAPSGYGVQASLFSQALLNQGHDVAISAYAGVHDETLWNGIQIFNCGGKEYGNGLIPYNYERWNADVVILLCDAFSIEPGQLSGLNVIPYMPVDCNPLSELDTMWLQYATAKANVHPVAMSRHGQAMLADKGYEAAFIPHAVDTSVYRPVDGQAWKAEQNLPLDSFLISLVGVNGGKPERKAFTQQMQAFKIFSDRHRKAAMYIHTIPQNSQGIDLVKVAVNLGLQGRLKFCDETLRNADAFGSEYMAGMYSASSFYSGATMAEGFGVPLIEAQACGTPVVATRASAMTELVPKDCGKLVTGDLYWSWLHNSWWVIPSVNDLVRAYEFMFSSSAGMRKAALKNGESYSIEKIAPLWTPVLESI